jgi:hypothetical protein
MRNERTHSTAARGAEVPFTGAPADPFCVGYRVVAEKVPVIELDKAIAFLSEKGSAGCYRQV